LVVSFLTFNRFFVKILPLYILFITHLWVGKVSKERVMMNYAFALFRSSFAGIS